MRLVEAHSQLCYQAARQWSNTFTLLIFFFVNTATALTFRRATSRSIPTIPAISSTFLSFSFCLFSSLVGDFLPLPGCNPQDTLSLIEQNWMCGDLKFSSSIFSQIRGLYKRSMNVVIALVTHPRVACQQSSVNLDVFSRCFSIISPLLLLSDFSSGTKYR